MDLSRRVGLVSLLVLSTVLFAEAQSANVMPRYQNFLNQHVYGNMAESWCTSEIRSRKITDGNSNNCKDVNTFIRATVEQVKAVCGKATGYYTSGQPFSVVTCKLKSGERRPDCVYTDRRKKGDRSRYIRIACDQGWPVHYDEDYIVVD
ncbi:ribonuclease like 2 precursor [Silurus asotus]|uniref:Ribonuclease like 2 n=1 Tax=Silurus asotus TaxID=30991 RepID=A0AAD5FV76_SILAS|nr:ribonuclease like 2 precursor [Silurus asotus]